jgi:UDPglucose 6-dehydrogenase
MLAEGADVHATDPEAISRAQAILPQITYHHDPFDALRDAEAALICTEWDEFRQLDWDRAAKLMARRLVVDGRNLCSPQRMRDLDFEYFSFGRDLVRTSRLELAR